MVYKETKIGLQFGNVKIVYERRVEKQEPVRIPHPETKVLAYYPKKGGNVNVYA